MTNSLYRLAQLFPKKEPLRYKMRGVAIDILDKVLRITNKYEHTNMNDEEGDLRAEVLNDIGIMQAFLTIAKEQSWVKTEEVLSVSKEYDILKQELENSNKNNDSNEGDQQAPIFQALTADQPVIDFESSHKNRQRQEKILSVLKEKGKVQVWELKQIMPGVSKRTLRRDFEYMLNQGMVERVGEKNQTFYRIGQTDSQVVLL